MRYALAVLAAVVMLHVVGAARAAEPLRFDEQPGKSLSLLDGSRVIWTLNFDGKEGKPFFHPLRTRDGYDLVWHRPPDHPWHLGLWYSWKYINRANFWDPKEHMPNDPGPGVIKPGDIKIERGADFSATVTIPLSYHIAQGPAILNEVHTLRIMPPRADGAYWIDWSIVSTAGDVALEFERTKPQIQHGPPWGGYAGLAYRCAPGMTQRRVMDSNGWENAAKLIGHGQKAKWMDFSGVVDAKSSKWAGVTLMDHPTNLRSPSPWYVYMDRAIGLTKTGLIFHEPLKMEPKGTLSLRYRVLVHDGKGDKTQLESEYAEFAK